MNPAPPKLLPNGQPDRSNATPLSDEENRRTIALFLRDLAMAGRRR